MSKITTASDPDLVARARMVREHLGVGEDFRVEDLSPAEFLALQVKATLARLQEAKATMDAAQEAFDIAWLHWMDAKAAEEKAREKD